MVVGAYNYYCSMQSDNLVNLHVYGYARHQICIQAVSTKACAEMEGSTMIMVHQVGTGRLVELRGAAAGLELTAIWLVHGEDAIHMGHFVPSRSNCGEKTLGL